MIQNVKNAQISERNKKLILDCVNSLVLENLSKPRLMRYLCILKIYALKLGKDLDKASSDDIKQYIGEIQQSSDYL